MIKNISLSLLLLTGVLATYSCSSHESGKAEKISIDLASLALDTDPVCKMPVEGHLADTLNLDGKLYGFCNTACKQEFAKSPETYLK
jgi:YHS domain-containing protein